MRNFIFISPNFPTNYWHFCRELRMNGFRVLGIGDQSYDELSGELRQALHEYYKVSSLENYDEVYRAVAFFIFRYGRIDFLESNNEYWLEMDARLRTDFHISSGWQTDDLPRIKYKSRMKEGYAIAGVPFARFHLVDDYDHCMAFIREVGFPVIVKPDNGVDASDTHELNNEDDLRRYLELRHDCTYIMEEFIHGEIQSYDAIIDSHGNPVFETGNDTPKSIMDMVNEHDNTCFYMQKELPDDIRDAGRRTVRAFGVQSRFVHFEFFRLLSDQHIGRKGEVVALEVNMRPCGGFSPDMMNFANGTDVYKIYADMIAYDSSLKGQNSHQYCAFIGRRDGRRFALSNEALSDQYASSMRMRLRLPQVLAEGMGDEVFIAVFDTKEEMDAFFHDGVREE